MWQKKQTVLSNQSLTIFSGVKCLFYLTMNSLNIFFCNKKFLSGHSILSKIHFFLKHLTKLKKQNYFTRFLIHKLQQASVSNHPWSMWNMIMRIGMIVFRMTFWIYRFDSWRFLVFFVNTSGFSVVRACLVQIGRSVNSICIVITIRTLHLDSIFFQRKKLFKIYEIWLCDMRRTASSDFLYGRHTNELFG